MKFRVTNSQIEVTTLDEWREHCAPVNPHIQWKDKRSAKEMARFWLNVNNQETFRKYLNLLNPNIQFETAYPEHPSKFDDYARPRINDLCIYAKGNKKQYFISIEGKADEPYGTNYFLQEFQNSIIEKQKNINSKKLNRAIELFNRLGNNDMLFTVRYQLLYWLAGSIDEAKRKNISDVVLISQEFHSDKTTEEKCTLNARDLNNFVSFVSESEITEINHGDLSNAINNHFTKGINLYFGKYIILLK
jgi:hypothetical protein